MQTDPIGYEDQYNLYAYVGNDPINGVDPRGLNTVTTCDGSGEPCKQTPSEDPIPEIVLVGDSEEDEGDEDDERRRGDDPFGLLGLFKPNPITEKIEFDPSDYTRAAVEGLQEAAAHAGYCAGVAVDFNDEEHKQSQINARLGGAAGQRWAGKVFPPARTNPLSNVAAKGLGRLAGYVVGRAGSYGVFAVEDFSSCVTGDHTPDD